MSVWCLSLCAHTHTHTHTHTRTPHTHTHTHDQCPPTYTRGAFLVGFESMVTPLVGAALEASVGVGDAAACGGRGVAVESQDATEHAQQVEGQHHHHHAAQRDAGHPPEQRAQSHS